MLVGLGLPAAYVANRLGRTVEAMKKRCRVLRLPVPPSAPPRRRGPWSEAEDQLLDARAEEPLGRLVAVFGRHRCRSAGDTTASASPSCSAPTSSAHRHAANSRPDAAIAEERPLTPTRALALARRLDLPLAEIRRIARQHRSWI